jgi:hypothetical protein
MMRRACFTLALLCGTVSPSAAQVFIGRPHPRAGSVEISGGALIAGGKDLPDVAATLTRNPGTASGAFELFRSDATLTNAFGGFARVGVYLSPAIAVEGGLQYTRPEVQVRLTGDFENAPNTTASETLNSYLVTGSLLYHFGRNTNRVRPFILGGGGHVRDVHEFNAVVDTGMEFHAGGGFKARFGGTRSKLGLRADVVASIREGGVATEEGTRVAPTAALSLTYVF